MAESVLQQWYKQRHNWRDVQYNLEWDYVDDMSQYDNDTIYHRIADRAEDFIQVILRDRDNQMNASTYIPLEDRLNYIKGLGCSTCLAEFILLDNKMPKGPFTENSPSMYIYLITKYIIDGINRHGAWSRFQYYKQVSYYLLSICLGVAYWPSHSIA